MTNPAGPARRSQMLWSSRLWILSAIIGVAVVWSTATLIHDDRQRRATMFLVARDKAEALATLAGERFARMAGERCRWPASPASWDASADGALTGSLNCGQMELPFVLRKKE